MPRVHFANSSPTREAPAMKEIDDKLITPHDHEMLRVQPSDSLMFTRGENSEASVDLTSTAKYMITYKIQTTSPDKFRVRPRSGVLQPGERVTISILLKSDQRLADSAKDKFLVMCMPLPSGCDGNSTQHIQELWKHTNSVDVEQHRLCCVYKSSVEIMRNGYGSMNVIAHEGSLPLSNFNDLALHAKKLEKQIKFTQSLEYVIIFFMLIIGVVVVYILKIQFEMSEVQEIDPQTSCPVTSQRQ